MHKQLLPKKNFAPNIPLPSKIMAGMVESIWHYTTKPNLTTKRNIKMIS